MHQLADILMQLCVQFTTPSVPARDVWGDGAGELVAIYISQRLWPRAALLPLEWPILRLPGLAMSGGNNIWLLRGLEGHAWLVYLFLVRYSLFFFVSFWCICTLGHT